MKQYIDLLKAIEAQGTDKPAARANMPGSRSLFGYQFRHDLSEGFPLLTTKKMYWKGIVAELLWFLRGDTNIKFLVDNGVNIWNGDAYNYFKKRFPDSSATMEEFLERVKAGYIRKNTNFQYGDCGYQYGKVWTNWQGEAFLAGNTSGGDNHIYIDHPSINQITRVIWSLRETPESRRHIVTAVDPAHDTDLALYWCHSMFQFNCRPIPLLERLSLMAEYRITMTEEELDEEGIPKYKLDCHLYQRSADSILGVPFNIASYALLTHIISEIVGMIPGEFIHSFGDAHVYDNHKEAMTEQLSRTPSELPKLIINKKYFQYYKYSDLSFDQLISSLSLDDFQLSNYNPQPAIKAELSTG